MQIFKPLHCAVHNNYTPLTDILSLEYQALGAVMPLCGLKVIIFA